MSTELENAHNRIQELLVQVADGIKEKAAVMLERDAAKAKCEKLRSLLVYMNSFLSQYVESGENADKERGRRLVIKTNWLLKEDI